MKKKISRALKAFAVGAVILAFASGCAAFSDESSGISSVNRDKYDSNSSLYPVYSSLTNDEKDIYATICNAMESHKDSEFLIGEYDTEAELEEAIDWLDFTYQQIAYEQPDYFWVDPNYYTYTEVEYGGKYRLLLEISYTLDKDEAKSKKAEYDRIVEEITNGAEAQSTLYDKVLYVYDYILENTEYDHVLAESEESGDLSRSAYGCLVEGETVCSGYTLAFTSVMQKLGIECGAEFNSYGEFSFVTGHVWNYCNLDGEYYYFDLTWDDTGMDSDDYKPYMDYSHMFFGITSEELEASHLPLDDRAPTPACNGTKYNYFEYNGYSFDRYDYTSVETAILNQYENGYAALRFDSYAELLRAQSDLLDDGKIYEILPDIESVMYVTSDSNRHLYLFF